MKTRNPYLQHFLAAGVERRLHQADVEDAVAATRLGVQRRLRYLAAALT